MSVCTSLLESADSKAQIDLFLNDLNVEKITFFISLILHFFDPQPASLFARLVMHQKLQGKCIRNCVFCKNSTNNEMSKKEITECVQTTKLSLY